MCFSILYGRTCWCKKVKFFGSDSGRDKYAGLLTTAAKTAQSSTSASVQELSFSPGIGGVGWKGGGNLG